MADDVAVVALVISLSALVVALGQISQQFLGTAEGYRRCKEEVIGAWAARTHRKWHWYEFRYETKYTTPDIDLLSTSQYADKLHRFEGKKRGPYYLNNDEKDFATEEIHYTLHPRKGGKGDFDSDNELLVSWIPFLRELHRTYNQYWGKASTESCCAEPHHLSRRNRFSRKIHRYAQAVDMHTAHKQIMAKKTPSTQSTQEGLKTENELIDVENTQRTDIVITYRELSWDFMPSEVVRPLATTHLGPLVIMAIRLGMKWQELNPDNGTIRASGNGYSLSSTSIRGLGMVVQFSPDLGNRRPGDLIPSKAADKMICGILPGCSELEIRDYPLIGDNKKLSHVKSFLADLRVSPNTIADMADPGAAHRMAWWEMNIRRPPFNDAVILLCPFMPFDMEINPLQTSDCCAVQFPGWLGMEPCSTFTYYESRLILLSEITKRVKSFADSEKCPQYLLYVQETFAELEREYPDYFYGHFLGIEEHPCPRKHGRQQVKSRKDLINACRKAFEKTTTYFQDLQSGKGRPLLPYKQIVGAHVSFGKKAAFWVRDDQGYPDKGSLYRDKFGAWPRPDDIDPQKWHVDIGAKTVADVAWAYVHWKSDFIQEIRERIDAGKDTIPYSDDEIEVAWWMLMLRGVCWALSVRIDLPDQAVPSSYYGNRTPIWIT